MVLSMKSLMKPHSSLASLVLFVNQNKERARPLVPRLQEWCASHEVICTLIEHESKKGNDPVQIQKYRQTILDSQADLICVLGGDGTLLRAADAFAQLSIPLLPIQTGSVGFLMSLPMEHVIAALDELVMQARFPLDERIMLKAHTDRDEDPLYCTNEFVVTFEDTTRLHAVKVTVDHQYLATYRTDSLIISTATGSTGHNLSAHGPIIHPAMDAVAVTPVCAYALNLRPLVVPASQVIEISTEGTSEPLILVSDGQSRRTTTRTVSIARSKHPLLLVKTSRSLSFFDTLHQKFNWQ